MSSSETSRPRSANTSPAAARMRRRLRSASARRGGRRVGSCRARAYRRSGRQLLRVRATLSRNRRAHLRFFRKDRPHATRTDPHHERRWLILARHRHRPAHGRARRDDREHRAADRAAATSASPTTRASGSSPPTRWRSARCCCSAARSATSSAASGPSSAACSASPSPRPSAAPPAPSACSSPPARAAGRLRRAARARRALGAADHDLHRPGRARQGVRHLRRDRRRRRRRRPAARRHPHRGALLALVPVREPRCSPSPPRSSRFRLLVNRGAPGPPAARPPGHAARHRAACSRSSTASRTPRRNSWGHPVTIVALGAAVVLLLAAFVVVESRVAHPLLPLRVVADRTRGGVLPRDRHRRASRCSPSSCS